jgi:hypothetical protein
MQIESQENIAVLLQQMRVPVRGQGTATKSVYSRSRAAGRCACRRCKVCEDNARWERVFNDKFADPNYYSPRQVTQGSSLASL